MKNLIGKSPRILVIGDLMIDHYLWGFSNRISPEAPIPIINIKKDNTLLGGAGNVINNLISFGAQVDVMSVIGDCTNSNLLKSMLLNSSIDTKYLIIEKGRICPKKTRIIAANQQVMRFDKESTQNVSKSSQDILFSNFQKIVSYFDCILLSDYGKGLLTNELTQNIIKCAKKNSINVLVDPKGLNYKKYRGAYLLTPNKKEAGEASNIKIENKESLHKAITKIKSQFELDISLITLSEDGVAIYDDHFRTYPTQAKEVFDVTGAGDTILAALGFSLSCGFDIDEAVKFANLAAGIVVGKIGSSSATLEEIIDFNANLNKSSTEKCVKSLKDITKLTAELKVDGKKIIFTNGCFDLLHSGHINYLETAKSFGDILIIGLNSDSSVKALKGDKRPINTQDDRAKILSALEVVDYVVIFEEDTPYNLIQAIQPHILVKGGDYQGKEVIGREIADELKLVKFISNTSTSKTIRKIKNETNHHK